MQDIGRQRDAEAVVEAWKSAHTTPAVRAPKLVPAAIQPLSLPLSRVSRSRDSAKSARATPRTRTLLSWGHGDQSSGLDEVRETSLRKPAGACTRMHAHAHAPANMRRHARAHSIRRGSRAPAETCSFFGWQCVYPDGDAH